MVCFWSSSNFFLATNYSTSSDSRIKPDVVAPGWKIKSARSDATLTSNQCSPDDLIEEGGTSMAAAVAVDSPVVLRQLVNNNQANRDLTDWDGGSSSTVFC